MAALGSTGGVAEDDEVIVPRVGLLVFNESVAREDVYRARKPVADREVTRVASALADHLELIRPTVDEIRGKRQARQTVDELTREGVDAAVLYVPVFASPALVAHTANLLQCPIALAGNEASDSLSQLAWLATGGAIDQIGLPCRRIAGDAATDECTTEILAWARACAVRRRLRGETYGCVGGRSLGISPGVADPALWQKVFGVDTEHVDQYELVQLAEQAAADDVQRHTDWLLARVGLVGTNDSNFTTRHLDRQVRSYLALKELIQRHELDFLGVKCQPELSNGYCLQCPGVSLCNDPYDADGPREPVACSCEADGDGALTMRILTLLTGHPSNLNDIAGLSDRHMVLANCGAMATSFAALSSTPSSPQESLRAVSLVPHGFGDAGGASVRFTVPEGHVCTFARLFRSGSDYTLGIFTGTTSPDRRAAQSEAIQKRPLMFVDMHIDKRHFLSTFGSNHIHAVPGDITPELRVLSSLLGINCVDYRTAQPSPAFRWYVCGLLPTHATEPPMKLTIDIPYYDTDTPWGKLDLAQPDTPASDKSPLVVCIHGGGWQGCDKSMGFERAVLESCTDKGMAAASVEYRLTQVAPFPACLHDVRCAIAFLLSKADEYGIDTSRVGTVGHSAGGHLATLAAYSASTQWCGMPEQYDDAQIAVHACVGVCGVYDMTGYREDICTGEDKVIARLITGTKPSLEARLTEASPVTYVNKDTPPTRLIAGEQDETVPVSQARGLYKALQDAGVESDLVVYDDRGHDANGHPDTQGHIAGFFARQFGL